MTATIISEPYVNHIPTMARGAGLFDYYRMVPEGR
jgi:hypothetical protein